MNTSQKLHESPKILLVNPWIHDFAAYDFWSKPLGLMILASILRVYGANVSYIDCLNRYHPLSKNKISNLNYGKGSYIKTFIPKPESVKDIPRNYCRYGILLNWFEHDLKKISPPDVILISSIMTYWYPGIKKTIEMIKKVYPKVPIILGGIYPSLCKNHAIATLDADYIISGPGEKRVIPLISKITGWFPKLKLDYCALNSILIPSFNLQYKIDYIPILTGRGCPYNCSYCASNFLQPDITRKSIKVVINEILFWYKKYNVNDFVFYDDALLVDSKNHIIPILEGIIKLGLNIRFHTPNAIHVREINKKIAKLMFKSRFKTIRLGVETTNFKNIRNIDEKIGEDEFQRAAKYLIEAGFKKNQIGAYLLVGLPKQKACEIENSINIVKKSEVQPILAYYSPIPHTSMWESAVKTSRYDLESDPIFTNNAILPCIGNSFSWKFLSRLKQMVKA